MSDIAWRVAHIRKRMEAAAGRAGRAPGSVRLVAVSKLRTVPEIEAVLRCGVSDIGESRVQEAEGKHSALTDRGIVWHLVGHLQGNKAKRAIRMFDWIHSLDSVDLARRVSRLAEEEGRTPRVLIQVDLAGEATKSGLPAEELFTGLEHISALPHLRVEGLMVLPPFFEDPEQARPYFRRLRQLRDRAVRQGAAQADLPELSMGMSHDFEVAIEEGATLVRVGTALFGERPGSSPDELRGR